MPSSARSQVRFGHFAVDLAARELLANGRKVPLQQRPYEILVLLLEKPGEVITREDLRQRLWPADTFVDFEHNINTAVRKLREALRDDPDRPRFIETVPRVGYRFRVQHPLTERCASRTRLAVVPFDNLHQAGGDRFAAGLMEVLVARLDSKCNHLDLVVPGLIPHDKEKTSREICVELNADYLLCGSVLHMDGVARIVPRLIRAIDQCCVWTNVYLGRGHQDFSLQEEIASSIAVALAALPVLLG